MTLFTQYIINIKGNVWDDEVDDEDQLLADFMQSKFKAIHLIEYTTKYSRYDLFQFHSQKDYNWFSLHVPH